MTEQNWSACRFAYSDLDIVFHPQSSQGLLNRILGENRSDVDVWRVENQIPKIICCRHPVLAQMARNVPRLWNGYETTEGKVDVLFFGVIHLGDPSCEDYHLAEFGVPWNANIEGIAREIGWMTWPCAVCKHYEPKED